jgi:DNA ligase (NAD+)
MRDSNSIPTQFINVCPECSTELDRPEGEAVFRCPNYSGCPTQIKGKIEHFIGRKAMDVSSLGEGKIDVLYQSGLLHRPVDLYELKYADILGLSKSIINEDSAEERVVSFKEKTVQNILDGIQASKGQPFERVLFALGIRFVGETVAKKLAYHFKSMDALMNASLEDLNAAPEIGEVIARSLRSYFSSDENKTEIEQMKSHGLNFNVQEKELSSNKLENLRFVVSGVFSLFSRTELKKIIEDNGGKNVSSISKSTDYLIVGENMGPAKKEKAEKLGIKMIDEIEFSTMIAE